MLLNRQAGCRDQPVMCSKLIFAAALTLACTTVALAQSVTDTASGLSITPPQGYVAETITPRPRYASEIGVRRPEDPFNMGCRVGYQSAPQNSKFTQKQINEHTANPEWINLVRATLAFVYEIASIQPFEHDGARGAVVLTTIKQREGLPPEALDIRTFLVILETPKGRTNVACVARKDTFEARQAEFEAVVRAVTLPR